MASLVLRTGPWRAPVAATSLVLGLGACAYDVPIRDVVSPADVAMCRRIGDVGFTRTDGSGPAILGAFGTVRVHTATAPASPLTRAEISGPNFGVTLDYMRRSAYALGATDLLLSRRIYHDWSYVAGIAYRCPS